ncbi:MAG: ROK family protein [Thermodesulfobacteriota bacterium]
MIEKPESRKQKADIFSLCALRVRGVMMGRVLIGVDLGGTNVRIGMVTLTGRVIRRKAYGLDTSQGGSELIEGLVLHLKKFIQKEVERPHELLGIGIGIAGVIEMRRGRVVHSPNIPDLNGFALRAFLKKRIPSPIVLENDANAFALGEGWVGAAKGAKHYCGITLGTGVGGGIVVNGEILHGASGMASEVGHMVIDPDGPPCGCGGRGCLEVYASATAIRRMALGAIERGEGRGILGKAGGKIGGVSSERVFEAARSGDRTAQEIFREMGRFLGLGLVNLIHLFNPEKIVIGGKVSRAWDAFIKSTTETVRERAMEGPRERVEIVHAKCGDDAGLLGAAFACLRSKEHRAYSIEPTA